MNGNVRARCEVIRLGSDLNSNLNLNPCSRTSVVRTCFSKCSRIELAPGKVRVVRGWE